MLWPKFSVYKYTYLLFFQKEVTDQGIQKAQFFVVLKIFIHKKPNDQFNIQRLCRSKDLTSPPH